MTFSLPSLDIYGIVVACTISFAMGMAVGAAALDAIQRLRRKPAQV